MATPQQDIVRALLDQHGRTYAADADIRLADRPAALFQLLTLALLLSARIRASVAVAAAQELFSAGFTTARKMADASWRDRVDALGRGSYRRYDERTATMLGATAELIEQRWGGDLRRLRSDASGDHGKLRALLTDVPGIGDTGVDIFCREAQEVWPELRPYLDRKALDGAARLGLPKDAEALAALVDPDDLARFAAGLVRVALNKKVTEDVRPAAKQTSGH
jgi:endonuclease III